MMKKSKISDNFSGISKIENWELLALSEFRVERGAGIWKDRRSIYG